MLWVYGLNFFFPFSLWLVDLNLYSGLSQQSSLESEQEQSQSQESELITAPDIVLGS